MIQPNADCALFCDWLLYVSWQPLSTSQRNIVETVNSAAVAVTPITNNTWYNFNKFTAWRYPFYRVYADLAAIIPSDLLLDLVVAWDFEGNSVSNFGSFNGTDHNITYGTLYGKINQGAHFTDETSYIDTPALVTGVTFTLSVWVRVSSTGGGTNVIWHDGIAGNGLFYAHSGGVFTFHSGTSITNATTVPTDTWVHVLIVSNTTEAKIYINGVDDTVTPALFVSKTLDMFGFNNSSFEFRGDLDAPNFWSRELNAGEILELYNAGAGIQYPF